MRKLLTCFLAIIMLTALPLVKAQTIDQAGFVPLFNGKNFKGFKILNGDAKYTIEKGVIVGTSKLNTPNTFLATEIEYSDFILEYDVFIDNKLNSGVQIRSLSLPEYQEGRVHGYQIEIDPSPRAYSGGIYDEARRGWMYTGQRNDNFKKAFKPGQWNSYHVEAIGNSIRVWVNGVMTSNLVDDLTAKGFIALQVHSINNVDQEGTQVRWKNLRIRTTDLSAAQWPIDSSIPEISYLLNKLTPWEIRKGYRLLFDGKTSTGWRSAKATTFPEKGWEVNQGILTIQGTDGAESAGPGDIITQDLYSNFELELDFMITKGANSGVKYFVDPEINKGSGSAIGCEFQLLDDKEHPDAKLGTNGNRTLGSLYDLIPAKPTKRFSGIGTWNRVRIVSNNGKVEHWLNNELVVSYDRNSQMFEALVSYSKYKDWQGFGRWPQGHILLQDHGNTVSFRSIKIKEL